MNVYSVIVEQQIFDDGSFALREGPIHVSAVNYTEVETKMRASSRYGDRRVAKITLLGSLDNI